jgi:hypothetical protein
MKNEKESNRKWQIENRKTYPENSRWQIANISGSAKFIG